MRKGLVFSFAVLLFWACNSPKYNGFKQTQSGIWYKFHKLGSDRNYTPQSGDRVYAEIIISNPQQEVIYNNGFEVGSQLRVDIGKTKNGSISEALSMFSIGDSASFKFDKLTSISAITAGKLKHWNAEYELAIKVNKIESFKSNNEPVAQSLPDYELLELKSLKGYLDSNNFKNRYPVDGVFIRKLKQGKGVNPQSGQQVWINYKGRFLNGEEFDNTYLGGQALDFQLGKPDQVIRAFEIAIHKMKRGEVIELITPSQYAFGSQGSATGIVPPYTSLIYEIELVRIN